MIETTHPGQTGAFLYSSLGDDPDLGELVEMFVDEMPDRIATLKGQFESADWESLRRTAHQLKGAAGSYGFEQITPVAARLEQACSRQESDEEIRAAYQALVEMCGNTRAGAPQ